MHIQIFTSSKIFTASLTKAQWSLELRMLPSCKDLSSHDSECFNFLSRLKPTTQAYGGEIREALFCLGDVLVAGTWLSALGLKFGQFSAEQTDGGLTPTKAFCI